ncbi:Uncharacterised protein g3246 [Pycnogonum litorale]
MCFIRGLTGCEIPFKPNTISVNNADYQPEMMLCYPAYGTNQIEIAEHVKPEQQQHSRTRSKDEVTYAELSLPRNNTSNVRRPATEYATIDFKQKCESPHKSTPSLNEDEENALVSIMTPLVRLQTESRV